MARLTSDELKALREKEDWQALWAYAVSWVKYVATTIKTNEREDMIQDALLVVGKAVPKWDPAKSQFPTYVRRVAKNAMLNHVYSKTYRAERTAALDVEDLDTDSGPMAGMGFTYGDTNYTPQGFGDPVSEIGREFAAESVEHFFKANRHPRLLAGHGRRDGRHRCVARKRWHRVERLVLETH
jgi:hypothetical protein